ncbi:MAG: nucleoside 2-deoxyribosyltransferase domain-containing protein [Candidatus Peribacteria bacterium]|jgi:hypothetical protein|nr:nucleoside 2-deoxyribosyltransferase domain-containing protein [Candidatus Peribacteria bacterium]
MNKNVIGLFGTCGASTWRDAFMAKYQELGIEYFNPQKDDWKPEDAENEAEHLASDQIILFPITDETYGMGSLSETGFSILNAIKLDDRRDFVILVSPTVKEELQVENPALFKESTRARALVKQHLKKLNFSNLYVVETLDEMLKVSIALWNSYQVRQEVAFYALGS